MSKAARQRAWLILALVVLVGAGVAVALALTARGRVTSAAASRRPALTVAPARPLASPSHRRECWVATWGASPQAPAPGTASGPGLDDQTVREIVTTSIGGPAVRVRFSNAFARRPLDIGRAAIGLQRSGAAVTRGAQTLTFLGHASSVVPAGADVVSDPVRLPVGALAHVAVSVFAPGATGPLTQHQDAAQTSYLSAGDHVTDEGEAAFTTTAESWLLVDGLDVLSSACRAHAVVALGDSITDGIGSTVNADARWPNDLARRLARAGAPLAVVDEGIGGNRVLYGSSCCGASALARLDRDALTEPGAKELIVLEGINDVNFSHSGAASTEPHARVSAAQLIAGYEQIIARAHAAGLKVFGGTLLPFRGARYWTPSGETVRDAVNHWIRSSRAFDGVIDFAAAVADRGDLQRLAAAYDSGDHLHPDDAGYRAMADAVDLKMLLASVGGRRRR